MIASRLARVPLLLLLGLAIAGCDHGKPARPADAQPMPFRTIRVHFEIYLARLERTTTLDGTGHLEQTEITNKSYGPHDIDPTRRHLTVRAGGLKPDQLAELIRLWSDADRAAPASRSLIVDGPDLRVEFNGVLRFVGGQPSGPLQAFLTRLDALAAAQPIVSR